MSNRRGPHVIARPRKRADVTTTEIDTTKLNELVAAVDPKPEVSFGRATTRSVSDEALAEIMAQQTRVAPAPTGPSAPRLAHTVKRPASEGESFDDPTTIHTRATGTVPIAVERPPRAATVEHSDLADGTASTARGSAIVLPLPAELSAAVAQLASHRDRAPTPRPVDDVPIQPSKLAEGSAGMIPVLVRPATESVEVSLDETVEPPVAARAPSRQLGPVLPIASAMRVPTIALSGLLAALVVALAWWLVH